MVGERGRGTATQGFTFQLVPTLSRRRPLLFRHMLPLPVTAPQAGSDQHTPYSLTAVSQPQPETRLHHAHHKFSFMPLLPRFTRCWHAATPLPTTRTSVINITLSCVHRYYGTAGAALQLAAGSNGDGLHGAVAAAGGRVLHLVSGQGGVHACQIRREGVARSEGTDVT